MLTGQSPFRRDTVADTLAASSIAGPVDCSCGIDARHGHASARHLPEDPRSRFRDIGDVRLALQDVDGDVPAAVLAGAGATWWARTDTRVECRCTAVGTGAAALALVVLPGPARRRMPPTLDRFVIGFDACVRIRTCHLLMGSGWPTSRMLKGRRTCG